MKEYDIKIGMSERGNIKTRLQIEQEKRSENNPHRNRVADTDFWFKLWEKMLLRYEVERENRTLNKKQSLWRNIREINKENKENRIKSVFYTFEE